jgi:hypothetical protein
MSLSEYPFCHGDRGEIGRSRMPIARSRSMTTAPYTQSRSRTIYRGVCCRPYASVGWRAIQWALGRAVTPSHTSSRRECCKIRNPYNSRNEILAKLAKRPPPNPVERAAIEKGRRRTKARAPRVVMHIEDRGKQGTVVYPAHSDEEGHQYRLADAFGTRSLQFVCSILKDLGKATEDHSGQNIFPGGVDGRASFSKPR